MGPMWADVVTGYSSEFHSALEINRLKIETVEGDGYCLFHAVAIGLGRRGEGMLIFEELLGVLTSSQDELVECVNGSVDEYLSRLRKDGYGDEIEIKYMKEIYGIDITIWVEDEENGATTDSEYPVKEGSINIAYRNGVHYDAVVTSANSKELKSNVEQDCCRVEPIPTDEYMHTGDSTTKQLGKLKIIFWNSNGWDQERCDKISEVALE